MTELEQDLPDTFAQVARSLAEQSDVQSTLQRIVELAVDTIPGAEHAGVTEVRARRRVETIAATDDVPRDIDRLQYQAGQGPCLDAIWEHEIVEEDDLSQTERWPGFSRQAVQAGVRSMLAFRLFVEQDTAGALNLYSTSPCAFDDDAVRVGHAFAAHASVAWEHEKEVDGLKAAVETRNVIGQAQGILMAQHKITPDDAFDRLRTASQRRNVKLREIAQEVAATGELR